MASFTPLATPMGSNMGHQACYLPRAPSNLGTPLLQESVIDPEKRNFCHPWVRGL